MEDVVSFWKGRRVFVTGHTGFKGGWLTQWLADRGAHVRGFARRPMTESQIFGPKPEGEIEEIRGDVLDAVTLAEALHAFAPEIVFHLSGQPIVRRAYEDPAGTYAANVVGTSNLLEAVRKASTVRAVVCITSDKVYANKEWAWPYRETDALGGFDPYSASKACAEVVVASYRNAYFPLARWKEHGVALATVRAGNVIGGGDWSRDRLIPDLIRGFQAGEVIPIRRPKAIRPWQHVLEPLHGYLLVAEHLMQEPERLAPAFNFGPREDDVWTVDRIAAKLAGLWGEGAAYQCDADDNIHEAHLFLRLDASLAHAQLGWQPRLHIEAALEWTLRWYQAQKRGEPMQRFTQAQIADYERLPV